MNIQELIGKLAEIETVHGNLPVRIEAIRLEGGKAKLSLADISAAEFNSNDHTKICVVIRAET